MRLVAHCFPPTDHQFVALVEDLVGSVDGADLEDVAHAVRERYPNARLALQSSFATEPGSDARIVYAYRDGSILPEDEP